MKNTPKRDRETERQRGCPLKKEAQNLKTAFGLSGKGISEGGKLRQRAATSKEVASETSLRTSSSRVLTRRGTSLGLDHSLKCRKCG